MTRVTRRNFLRSIGSSLPLGAAVLSLGAKQAGGFTMGAQSFSFRKFSFEDSIAELKELGLDTMEFCAVHFPPDPSNPNLDQIKGTLKSKGVKVPCFGVEGFTADAAANRAKFEFAGKLGIGILTADPTPDAFGNLEELVEEFGIGIAIHNHGPGARYDKVRDTLDAVKGRHARIGACVDTGHAIRSGEKPHETIRKLGDRVVSIHLKDWTHGGEEQVLGEGDMDLVEVARALKDIGFTGPVVMEYELEPENPVPGMKKGWENWVTACEKV